MEFNSFFEEYSTRIASPFGSNFEIASLNSWYFDRLFLDTFIFDLGTILIFIINVFYDDKSEFYMTITK